MSADLTSELDELRSQWQGAGGRAFFVLHEAWSERQRRVVSALDELAAALHGTERDVTTTDDAQAAAYHQDLGRLGG